MVIILQVVLNQQSKFLLILDDVWDSEVARAFAVQCSALITTRNTQVVQGIPKQQKLFVSVSDGKFFQVLDGRTM